MFLLTGLQVRTLIERAPFVPIRDLAVAIAVTTVIIVARFVWVFPATYLPRFAKLAQRDPPPWQHPFLLPHRRARRGVARCGACDPATLANGAVERDLILVITFGVIILTLVRIG